MMLAAAVYVFTVSLVIGGLALLAERAMAQLRWPLRWPWMTAMLLMVLLPSVMLVLRGRATPASTTVAEAEHSVVATGTDTRPRSNAAVAPITPTLGVWGIRPADVWEQWLPQLAARTTSADAPLSALWVCWSTTMMLVAWRALRRNAQLSRVLPSRVVQGTPVLVSDAVGPAAIGGRASAIVIPEWVLQLDEALLSLVLRHEREHLRAHDPRLLFAGLVLVVVVPWHLPLWWAWHRMRLAIELDCDARVLRDVNSPRVYAQLLLFMSQQRRSAARRVFGNALSLPLLLAFNPHRQHLTRRINAMTTRRVTHPVRLVLLVAASAGTATLATAIPAPAVMVPEVPARAIRSASRPISPRVVGAATASGTATPRPTRDSSIRAGEAPAARVLVKVTHLGVSLTGMPTSERPMEIVIYGNGPVRVGLGTAAPTVLRDTIRLDHLPAFTADVSNGDVHVEMRRAEGTLELGGEVSGGAMSTFTVRARHVVLEKGGMGVRMVNNPLAPAPRYDSADSSRRLSRADSTLVPTSEQLDRRLEALSAALARLGAPTDAQGSIAQMRQMNRLGLPASERAALGKRLDDLRRVLLVDSLQILRRRLDSARY